MLRQPGVPDFVADFRLEEKAQHSLPGTPHDGLLPLAPSRIEVLILEDRR